MGHAHAFVCLCVFVCVCVCVCVLTYFLFLMNRNFSFERAQVVFDPLPQSSHQRTHSNISTEICEITRRYEKKVTLPHTHTSCTHARRYIQIPYIQTRIKHTHRCHPSTHSDTTNTYPQLSVGPHTQPSIKHQINKSNRQNCTKAWKKHLL
jgi:hypothetical protein